MKQENYIGIENEFVTFDNGEQVPFQKEWVDLLRKKSKAYYNISETSIRTETENGFYIDDEKVEILTPPIALNRGFASRLTDSLMIGRERLLEAVDGVKHTGYSMHWNLSYNGTSASYEAFLRGIALPFHLFGLTPLSVGFALRNGRTGRYELLGDSLNNEDQIKGLALLLGAYSLMLERYERFPLALKDVGQLNTCTKFLTNGRTDEVNVFSLDKGVVKIQAQKFLNAFYQWIKPMVLEIGTKREVKNLEGFISGEKQLEFDRREFYEHLRANNLKEIDGTYLPFETNDPQNPGTVLTKSGRARKVSFEGRLLGKLVDRRGESIDHMSWTGVEINGHGERTSLNTVEEIFKYATQFFPKSRRPKSYSREVKAGDLSEADFGGEFRFDAQKKGLVSVHEVNPNPTPELIPEKIRKSRFGSIFSYFRRSIPEYVIEPSIERDSSIDNIISNLPTPRGQD